MDNPKYVMIGSSGVGTTIATAIAKEHKDVLVVNAEQAQEMGLGAPEPMMISAPPELPLIEYVPSIDKPYRKKNRKQKKNIFGSSKYF